ncbi:Glutamine amidotransferases class-II [Chitinophaga eiseniae]|uniref:Glutamine amidotransferases class-II n=1 Tax=Chitinophaga eiseniae TaxID=634771 RepID=A0A1T4SYF7_9BACT|nr:class II glutamine amidotransferase [Chitinophaga eiseniae]SKA33139.1 Glutamine amidotransferases class-II [Chitinophaga eiseniae]
MCIAILNTKDTLSRTTFRTCWQNNPDGAGIAYYDSGTIKITKEMDCVDRLYESYRTLRKHNRHPMILHFRIATSGSVDADNCHPFEVGYGMVMAHNGIIDNVSPTATISDTRIFISEILNYLPEDFLYNAGIRELIGGFIDSSKLVFLDRYGMYHIINERLGHWDDDHSNWYSNYSYLETKVSPQYRSNHLQRPGRWMHRDSLDEEHWSACGCCDNLVETSKLHFDTFLQVNLCPDCLADYSGNYDRGYP